MLYVIMCMIPTSFQITIESPTSHPTALPTGHPTALPTTIPCLKGTYFSIDEQQCIACTPGTFQNGDSIAQCQLCVEGSYAPTYQMSECLPCPIGMCTIYLIILIY